MLHIRLWSMRLIFTIFALAILLPCAAWARTNAKLTKAPNGPTATGTRTLQMPPAHRAQALGQGRLNRRLAAGKRAQATTGWKIWRDARGKTPIFVQFDSSRPAAKRAMMVSPAAALIDFVAEHAALFHLRDPHAELEHGSTWRDAAGREHVRLAQQYRGVPIWGAEIIGHWSPDRGLYAINGRYGPTPEHIAEITPAVSAGTAVDVALADLAGKQRIEDLNGAIRRLLRYEGPQAELWLWSARLHDPVRLTWKIEIRPNAHQRWNYFVDAQSGQLLDNFQASPSDGRAIGSGVDLQGNTVDLHTLEDDGTFYLIDGSREGFDEGNYAVNAPEGALWTLDARYTDAETIENVTSDDNFFADPIAVSAHTNMERVYEYFRETHGRLGIAGDGTSTISVVHVTEDGESMENAYWNGVYMAYGDGGSALSPLAGSLDVAAHEMVHGIIERTVNLEYRFQSGALNESFADIFGAMVDDEDWQLGEDVVNEDYFPSGALRDLRDPHNGDEPGGYHWQPAHMDEYLYMDEDDDNGGVHYNSGIPNRAAYLIAEAIGREKTARVYYHILDAAYLSPRSQFVDCRVAAERAASDLFGEESTEVEAVRNAFAAVGIVVEVEEPAGEIEPDAEPVPPVSSSGGQGGHWVATVAAELDGDNSLWMVKPTWEFSGDWEAITQLTTTQVFAETGNAITAPLNGEFLLFIDSDNNLRYIGTDGSDEEVINDDGDWSSIALSPNGSQLVATTVYEDSSIYYFDLDLPENNRRIKLYHWTTQDEIAQSIARYADALQWDATGNYVVYDVFNSIPGPAGQTIDFWTVNVLDPLGEVMWSLFPPQPKGVHIGNSSLSNTILADGSIDDCRLLYEKVDEENATTEIKVLDLCTNESGVLHRLGYNAFTFPNFTNGDREVVFEEWLEDDGVNTAHLWRLPLAADGLRPAGDPLFFVPNSQSPKAVIIAGDESDSSTDIAEETTSSLPAAPSLAQNYPNPFNASTLISYGLPAPARAVLEIFNSAGQRVAALDQGIRPAGYHELHWRGTADDGRMLGSGVYLYRLRLPGAPDANTVRRTQRMVLLR